MIYRKDTRTTYFINNAINSFIIGPLLLWLCWNKTLTSIAPVEPISFWQALGLCFLVNSFALYLTYQSIYVETFAPDVTP